MTRVTFEIASSAFVACQTALGFGKEFPLAKHHVLNFFYVDDLLVGADSLEEAYRLFLQLQQLLLKGGFYLRK